MDAKGLKEAIEQGKQKAHEAIDKLIKSFDDMKDEGRKMARISLDLEKTCNELTLQRDQYRDAFKSFILIVEDPTLSEIDKFRKIKLALDKA